MKLTRIRIEQFKQFRQPLEIADLTPGINLITGPNEAGKSTLVTAIRAAFFERYRSSSADAFRPWGDSSAAPQIELDFDIGDTSYRLTKRFLGKKRCSLQAGGQAFDGADAEDHLAALLGFEHAGRGESKAEHWGIPGLLWMAQGAAQEIRLPVSHAIDHLRTALQGSLGEVTSSAGDDVLARVETERNELLTAATGKPRGAYAKAIGDTASLAERLAALDIEIENYRRQVDQLATLRAEHEADAAETPWKALNAQANAAREKLQSIAQIEETLKGERQRATQIEPQVTLLRQQLAAFARETEDRVARQRGLETASAALAAASAQVDRLSAAQAEASARQSVARDALRAARQHATRQQLSRELTAAQQAAGQAREALTQAEAQQQALADWQQQAASTEIKAGELDTLRSQRAQLRDLQIAQESAATQLRFSLDEGRSMEAGGESLTGDGERLLVEATTLTLPGLGVLEIVPGGTDLAELRRKALDLADQHVSVLQRLGLASLEAAEARHISHVQRLAEVKSAAAALRALAPKGVDALRTELAKQSARAQESEHALGQLTPAAEDAETPLPVTEAEAAEAAAAQSLERVNADLQAAKLAAGAAQTRVESATHELAGVQALLDAPDRAERQMRANQALVDALAEQAALAARIDALSTQVSAARPDILKQDVARFSNSAAQLEKRFSERRDSLLQLQATLESAGARGLDERRAECERDHAQAARRMDELQRRAAALDYLLTLLRSKRRALTQKLQAPLQRHLNHYLQLLFAGAQLEIDEDLSPGPLTRDDGDIGGGSFDDLSFGAREQMGVISRLAYADLLQAVGRPTLIILDDALVHSDVERLAQMKRALFDASTRHQILLLTCHPESWRDLGVAARSLDTIRTAAQDG